MLSCGSNAVQRAQPEHMPRKLIILALFAVAAAARELPAQQPAAPPPGPRSDTLGTNPAPPDTARGTAAAAVPPASAALPPGLPVPVPPAPLPPYVFPDTVGQAAAWAAKREVFRGVKMHTAAARETDSVEDGWIRALAEPGSSREERIRLGQLTGRASTGGFLLRSASTLTPRRQGAYVALLAPRAEAGWNSRIPFSVNDGPLWAGRGGWSRVLAGAEAAAGPLRIVLAPELVWQQNTEFDDLLPEAWDATQRGTFTTPWHVGRHAADLPYRFGDESETSVVGGESSVTLRLGPVEAGAATESQWWGPGVRSALLFTNQAGGFPHALLRTARPVRTPLGMLDARWIAGRLSSSAYDTASVGEHRSLSAAGVVLSPGAGLSIGLARVVYQPLDGRSLPGDAADVFTRWRGAGDTAMAQPYEQMSSLFVRWVFPGEAAEAYAEVGRRRLPGVRDLLERPEDTQGYLLGFAWARPARAGRLRLSGEATFLEKSPTYRALPPLSWYAGRAVPQGYTHRGQPLGSFVGPGASGQWLGLDYLARRGQLGVWLTRVRWSNDAYYDKPGGFNPGRYRGHDVSVLGTLRGALAVGGMWVEADWSFGQRFNFLFQNQSLSFLDNDNTVSPVNHTLRLGISLAPPALAF
jgi:hypothetical protein